MTDNLAEKYCVRVKSNGHTGSGVLLPGKETFYVLTAAHCLGDDIPTVEEIIIEKQNDYASDFKKITSVQITEFNREHDFALIEINVDNEEKLLYQYKLGRGIISESEIKFCGYQGINLNQYRPFTGKILSVSEDIGCFKITLVGDTFDQAGEDGSYLAKGLSGSGVFVYRHNTPFLIGILNSVITDKAWNDDIECCSIKHIEQYITEYVDLASIENLKQWDENIEKERTEREIEAFKSENSDFFEKLYRKNNVLYPETAKANLVTAKQIRKYLGMKDNIRTIENDYPKLYSNFKNIVKRFVDQVEFDYSRSVNESNEAIDLKMELQKQLKKQLEIFLPSHTNIDLSEYQIIEWLGICTLNFSKND
ncbi:trypsin-like serine protease [Elizabethkingia anophelis]|uniref:trypsin-like serine protease n=1 Tax=Elizabethkingia anophelis TaxID=1117645 RepID=UPI00136A7CC0|nr:trypsin-like serine protease [Elizabethkingia anophelis]MYY44001.1 serine protease [Elizabethkingia anophelis]